MTTDTTLIPLPSAFLLRAKKFMGEEYEKFANSFSDAQPISIRLNSFKKTGIFSEEEKIPWSINGRYLKERPSFTMDPLFHAGCYYVQDASSQFLEKPFLQAMKLMDRSLRVLDLCAAPGGKSTHILSMLNDDDLLVSNELISGRNNILRQNIMKWGNANVIVTQNDPADFDHYADFFDIIVVDAPCSGEGLFRKDEKARDEWSVENVNHCAVRQTDILKHAFETLKPGGFLIYSTCTFEDIENDKQVEKLISQYGMKNIPIDFINENIVSTQFGYMFYPHKIRGEGFYISMLQKSSEDKTVFTRPKINTSETKRYLNQYLVNPVDFIEVEKDDRMYAIPAIHLNAFNHLQKKFYIRLAGIYLGEIKGNDFIPSEALALSNNLRKDIPVTDLSYDEAIDYLRGGNPPVKTPKGFGLVSYKNNNLGWIKNMGARMNNYYPKEWRIKK